MAAELAEVMGNFVQVKAIEISPQTNMSLKTSENRQKQLLAFRVHKDLRDEQVVLFHVRQTERVVKGKRKCRL
jgi:F0F1-type ATP synthase beta subunit